MRLALSIEYKGTYYYGWQKQNHHKNKTIQYHIEKAISKVANENISTTCAGRTDTGVHAFSQIIHFDTIKKRTDYKWITGINTYLPDDILVNNIFHVDDTFHSRYSALNRTYRYIILNQQHPSPLLHDNVLYYKDYIDVDRMKNSIQYLEGQHDFSCFQASGCSAKSPIRVINKIIIKKVKNLIYIDIKANSFLYHMVRNIVGCLLDVSTKKHKPKFIKELILSRDRTKAGKTVLSSGLYLMRIDYPKKYNIKYKKISGLFN